MLLCESIHRLEEDIYENNMGDVATVVEILHLGIHGDDAQQPKKRPPPGHNDLHGPERQPLDLDSDLRQNRRQITITFDDATTVHVFETRQNMATFYTDSYGKPVIVDRWTRQWRAVKRGEKRETKNRNYPSGSVGKFARRDG